MKEVRASDRTGRYVPGPISEGVFSPEQLWYIREELLRISAAVNTLDEGWYPRWDDLQFPFTETKRGSLLKPDFDETNVGLLFPQNDTAEIVFMVGQMPHGYYPGSDIIPHVHWQQTGATFPTWDLEYKWFNVGGVVPGSFTTISTSTGEVPYVSGNLHQLSKFAAIDGAGKTLSSILLMKFYRNDNDVSGDVLAFEFDIHFQSIAPGSRNEISDV